MNRGDFQELAEIRLREAKALLDNECYDGAYYLAGYVIECALKAWIAKNIREYDFPDKAMIQKFYTHNLNTLISLVDENPPDELEVSWGMVKDWSEQTRYERDIHQEKAQDMYEAVADPEEGVFQWIKQHW